MGSAHAHVEVPEPDFPVTPSLDAWRGMSVSARDAHVLAVQEAITAAQMGQGRPHATSKAGIMQVLGDFFERIGRRIYLASELPVLYPGERAFEPDILAVRDLEDPGEADARMAWVVADEGRGPDLAMEILYRGSAQKDLVRNVAWYARLGIPEYFVYDRRRQRLHGYRLPPGARQYQSIPVRRGRLWSEVLELEVGIVERRLRFFVGEAMVPDARELIGRLDAMMAESEQRIEGLEALAAAESAARVAEAAARVEAEALAASESAARRELEALVAELRARLAERG